MIPNVSNDNYNFFHEKPERLTIKCIIFINYIKLGHQNLLSRKGEKNHYYMIPNPITFTIMITKITSVCSF